MSKPFSVKMCYITKNSVYVYRVKEQYFKNTKLFKYFKLIIIINLNNNFRFPFRAFILVHHQQLILKYQCNIMRKSIVLCIHQYTGMVVSA